MSQAEVHLKWNQVLSNTKVEDILLEDTTQYQTTKKINPDSFSIAFVETSDTVSETIKVLVSNHISSAPVYHSRLNKFVGFIDMLDLVGYALAKLYGARSNLTEEDTERGGEEFLSSRIDSLMNFSGRNAWNSVTQYCSILLVMKLLSDPDTHRIAITDGESNKVVAILTQSRIIKWLNDHHSQSGFPKNLGNSKVKDWKAAFVIKDQVQTISHHETVLQAFRKMYEGQISGLPIVNKDGRLIGTITGSDLKLIVRDPAEFFSDLLIRRMSMTLNTFLEWKSNVPRFSERDVVMGYARVGCTCTKDDTFLTVLERLQTKGFHRIWVVDEADKPTGVISLCDLLKECYHTEEEVTVCGQQ